MPLTVKRIITLKLKIAGFLMFSGAIEIKHWVETCCNITAKTPVFESLEDPINGLIHQDDTEQATVFQILLLKTLFSWLLNSLF